MSKKVTNKVRKSPQKSVREVIKDIKELPKPKATVAVTDEQYEAIVKLLWEGSSPQGTGAYIRRQPDIAIALSTQANLGLRIGDIVNLTMDSFVSDGGRWRFNMRESKTKKVRTFTVPDPVYNMLAKHAKVNGIKPDEKLFRVGIRDIQRAVQRCVDYLGYPGTISTHSFRKRFATAAYLASGDIEVVRILLQHSSQSVTQRYINIESLKVSKTLNKITKIVVSY